MAATFSLCSSLLSVGKKGRLQSYTFVIILRQFILIFSHPIRLTILIFLNLGKNKYYIIISLTVSMKVSLRLMDNKI